MQFGQGDSVGDRVGCAVGDVDGTLVGNGVGTRDGTAVGLSVGNNVGLGETDVFSSCEPDAAKYTGIATPMPRTADIERMAFWRRDNRPFAWAGTSFDAADAGRIEVNSWFPVTGSLDELLDFRRSSSPFLIAANWVQ